MMRLKALKKGIFRGKWLFFVLCSTNATAQENLPKARIEARFGQPTTIITGDSSFSLGIAGRIQAMAEFDHDRNSSRSLADFYIRRMRLNFTGHALSPKFTYRVQLAFSQRDISADNSSVDNNLFLRDAMLFYTPNRHWKIAFGQTKLPGNRQRQVSSGNLQFADRSNTNALFTLDRDKGLWITHTSGQGKQPIFRNTFAISSGEGRINSDKSAGLAYSFRTELLPFGSFSNEGEYKEADLEFEKDFKLAIAAAYSYNNKTRRVAGQLGEYLYNNQTADLHYYGGDVMMKYRGWSFIGEMYRRTSSNGISLDTASGKVNLVYTGTGLLLQSGYLFTKKDEVALRFGRTSPDHRSENHIKPLNEWMIAYSHYFFNHNLKLQTDAGYFTGPGQRQFQWRMTGVLIF